MSNILSISDEMRSMKSSWSSVVYSVDMSHDVKCESCWIVFGATVSCCRACVLGGCGCTSVWHAGGGRLEDESVQEDSYVEETLETLETWLEICMEGEDGNELERGE